MEILPPELQAATVAIVVLSLGVVTVCALRRAVRDVDTILCEELASGAGSDRSNDLASIRTPTAWVARTAQPVASCVGGHSPDLGRGIEDIHFITIHQ
ncbi:MAG: hypothetical protein JWQ81_2648 [Amycolatopsis sp.]|nr:hypothetical protein [Amycolatopsis sp.]